jgi:hypothetical protein
VREDLTILFEYDIPLSAIKKIEKLIPEGLTEEQIFDFIKNINQKTKIFSSYEINKISNI